MPTVVVFAGAGASRSVNESQYPTTVEFIRRLPDRILKQSAFELISEYLRSHPVAGALIDIELLLSALQDLEAFFALLSDPESVPGWVLRSDRLQRLAGPEVPHSSITERAPALRAAVSSLVDHINAQVFDIYSRIPEPFELEMNWLPLLEGIVDSGYALELFTTNYDLVIEAALTELEARHKIPVNAIRTGRRSGLYRTLDELLWARGPSDAVPKPVGLLTKLHGSVDWSRSPSGIYVGEPNFKGHEKQVILYPGFKGLPAAEPFASFHNYLAGAVANADYVVFIGFAFRDKYINDILDRFTASHAKILIINPADPPLATPFAKGRVSVLQKPFGAESASLALNTIQFSLSGGA